MQKGIKGKTFAWFAWFAVKSVSSVLSAFRNYCRRLRTVTLRALVPPAAGGALIWIYLEAIPDFFFQILAPDQSLGFPAGANFLNDIFARDVRADFSHGLNHSPDGGFIKRSVHFFPLVVAV
jgi:hypothetical protein